MFPSDAVVAIWHHKLKYFRFSRGPGGHGGNCDSLSARILFHGVEELQLIMARLECPLQRVSPLATHPISARTTGEGLPGDEPSKPALKPMRLFPEYAEPGICKPLGCCCLIAVSARNLDVLVCGAGNPPDYWAVTKKDYANALRLEAAFDQLGLEMWCYEEG